MKEFGFSAPSDVGEALKLMADFGENATVLAGGTDLVPMINNYDVKPQNLLYIGRLGLDYIREEPGRLVIGAATTTARLAASEVVAQKAAALSQAAGLSGSTAIRNLATVGGNLANASPAADLACALLALDADLQLASAAGRRVVPVRDFFTGPGRTTRRPDELLLEVYVPLPKGPNCFLKIGRRKALTLSVVNAAVSLVMDGRTCRQAHLVLGAVAPTPLRCRQAEEALVGRPMDAGTISGCAARAVAESSPIDDQRATAWYRRKAGAALMARALAQLSGAGI
jgi:CO/xanthine dehydrogenase FAD-binding subunit